MEEEVEALVVEDWVVVHLLELQDTYLVSISLVLKGLVGSSKAAERDSFGHESVVAVLLPTSHDIGVDLLVVSRVPLKHLCLEVKQFLMHVSLDYDAIATCVVLAIQQVLYQESVPLEGILMESKRDVEGVRKELDELSEVLLRDNVHLPFLRSRPRGVPRMGVVPYLVHQSSLVLQLRLDVVISFCDRLHVGPLLLHLVAEVLSGDSYGALDLVLISPTHGSIDQLLQIVRDIMRWLVWWSDGHGFGFSDAILKLVNVERDLLSQLVNCLGDFVLCGESVLKSSEFLPDVVLKVHNHLQISQTLALDVCLFVNRPVEVGRLEMSVLGLSRLLGLETDSS